MRLVSATSSAALGGQTTLAGAEVWPFSLNGLVDQQSAPPPPITKVERTGNPIKLGQPEGATNTLVGDVIFNGRATSKRDRPGR